MKLQKLGLLAVGISILAVTAGANAATAPVYLSSKAQGQIKNIPLKVYKYSSHWGGESEKMSKAQADTLVANRNRGKKYCVLIDGFPVIRNDYVSLVRNDEVTCAKLTTRYAPENYIVTTVIWRADWLMYSQYWKPKVHTVNDSGD